MRAHAEIVSRLFVLILAITSPYVVSCASSTKWQKPDPMQTVQVPLVWENLPSVKCPEDQRVLPELVYRQAPQPPHTFGSSTPRGRVILSAIVSAEGTVIDIQPVAA